MKERATGERRSSAHRPYISGLPSYTDLPRYNWARAPRQIRLEIATQCINACPWCHAWGGYNPIVHGGRKTSRPQAIMPVALAKQAIDEIAGWPVLPQEITPNNYNEAFMSPYWEEIFGYMDQKLPRVKLVLVTTGNMLTTKSVDVLLKLRALKYINFSINAFFQESYERIHGVSAAALGRIPGIIQRIRDARPDIWIAASMVYDTTLITEIEREYFEGYWKGRVNAVCIQNPSYADNPLRKPIEPVTLPCRSIFDGLVLLPDGRVATACCFDADGVLEVGRFPEQSLAAIWSGPSLRELGEKHNAGRRAEIAICRSCTFA